MKKNEEMLQKGSFPELAVHLCIPAIVIMLIMVIYDMADVYFIGKTADPVKVAAVSLCAPVFSMLSGLGTLPGSGGCIVLSLAMGICMGMQPALSYNCGAGNLARMRRIVRNLGILTVATGSALTAGCLIGRHALISAFIAHDEVIALGERMVTASMLMGPFYGIYQLCAVFLQSAGKASYATLTALLDKGIFYLPLLFGLNLFFGLRGVIYTAPLTDMASLAVGALLCRKWNREL